MSAACADETGSSEPPLEPLFSLAVIADTHITGDPEHEQRLQAAVDWLNHNAEPRRIELVLVLGDIGWGAGLALSKELLDELDMPYVPLIGDNEIYFGDDEAFDTVYRPQYQVLADAMDGWRMAPSPVWDPEAEMDAWYQNAAFDYRGLHLFALDWNVRGDDTVMSEFADLHEYEGGTWPWFQEQLAALEATKLESILLLSHIPMFLGGFDTEEMPQVTALLEPRGDYLYANLAGHLHGNLVKPDAGYDVVLTDATWDDDNTVRVIEVSGNATRFAYAHELVVVP